jgi:hypothetical protein
LKAFDTLTRAGFMSDRTLLTPGKGQHLSWPTSPPDGHLFSLLSRAAETSDYAGVLRAGDRFRRRIRPRQQRTPMLAKAYPPTPLSMAVAE